MSTKHNGRYTRLYNIWLQMKHRCTNPNNKYYHRYGGNGITVCKEWINDYIAFRDWAYANGYDADAPRGDCTLDRIDNNGNYEPSNCRWVSIKEQCRNRSTNFWVEVNGEKLIAKDCAKKYGIPRQTIIKRANDGRDVLTGKRCFT